MSVLSCRCCMFLFCVHHVEFFNAAFCMACSLLMLVQDEDPEPLGALPMVRTGL